MARGLGGIPQDDACPISQEDTGRAPRHIGIAPSTPAATATTGAHTHSPPPGLTVIRKTREANNVKVIIFAVQARGSRSKRRGATVIPDDSSSRLSLPARLPSTPLPSAMIRPGPTRAASIQETDHVLRWWVMWMPVDNSPREATGKATTTRSVKASHGIASATVSTPRKRTAAKVARDAAAHASSSESRCRKSAIVYRFTGGSLGSKEGTLLALLDEADIIRIARTVSGVEPDLQEIWDEGEGRRREQTGALVSEWEAGGALAPGLTAREATDVMWALGGPDVFRLFVTERGWSEAHFTERIASILEGLLFAGAPGPNPQ